MVLSEGSGQAVSGEVSGRRVPVERLRLGDHSCMSFTDNEARWQVLTSYTRTGLARGEKVLIILDPSDLGDDEAIGRMDGGTGHVAAAWDNGQLVIHRSPSVYLPDGRFDKERQIAMLHAEVDIASREGWSGLRVAGDASWALRSDTDTGHLMDYEASLEALFADRRIVAVCCYDRGKFGGYLVDTVNRIHPVHAMERLDAIDAIRTPTGARIAGSAELSTREEFTEVLREALKRPGEPAPFHFELDLTDLCFMEAHGAWNLISFAASLPEGSKITIRCNAVLEVVFVGLGAEDVPQLELSVEDERSEH